MLQLQTLKINLKKYAISKTDLKSILIVLHLCTVDWWLLNFVYQRETIFHNQLYPQYQC